MHYSVAEGVSIVLMSASVAASEPALRNIAERGAFSSLSVIAQPDRVSSLYFSHDPDDSVRPLKSPAILYPDAPRSASFVGSRFLCRF